jgi:branched-subunit amino acid ABC-type transport system permease component
MTKKIESLQVPLPRVSQSTVTKLAEELSKNSCEQATILTNMAALFVVQMAEEALRRVDWDLAARAVSENWKKSEVGDE